MKQIVLTLCTLVAFNVTISAQNFKDVLQNTVIKFDSAKSLTEMFTEANRLDLIAKKWDTSSIAHYYCAYAFTVISFLEPDSDKKDAYLDKSDAQLAKAKELAKKDNDELWVMAAFIANARLAVRPETRWKKYGDIFDADIAKAKALRPDNPRIYYLQGDGKYHTPRMFGGGAKNALPYFQKAEKLYKKESDTNIFKPSWGRKQNHELLEKCLAEEKE